MDIFNPTGINYHYSADTSDGGDNDSISAITHSNPVGNGYGIYTVEYRKPLNSSDDAHDFYLA